MSPAVFHPPPPHCFTAYFTRAAYRAAGGGESDEENGADGEADSDAQAWARTEGGMRSGALGLDLLRQQWGDYRRSVHGHDSDGGDGEEALDSDNGDDDMS